MKKSLTLVLDEDCVSCELSYIPGSKGDRETPPEMPEIDFTSVKLAGIEILDQLTDDARESLYNQALQEIEY